MSDIGRTVILEEGHELRDDALLDIPSDARRLIAAALATGWRTKCIRTVAAVPNKGVVTAITVRCARHDERVWASWWNGSFDSGQYVRAGQQIERLGADRMKTRSSGRVPLDSLLVPQLREMAKTHGIKLKAGSKKIDIIAALMLAGVMSAVADAPRRGVLDAVEGLLTT
jgi:hypothetical protein